MLTIVLATYSYPYSFGKEESFIDPELKSLIKSGILSGEAKVVIAPMLRKGHCVGNVPDGVEVVDWLTLGKGNILASIFRKRFFSLFLETFKNEIAKDNFLISNTLLLLKFCMVYSSIYSKIETCKNINDKTHVFGIYTYWFNACTTAWLDYKRESKNIEFVISRAHGVDLYDYRRFHPRRLKDIELIDAVYTVSEDGRKYLIDKYGFKDKIFTSYLGVDCFDDVHNYTEPEHSGDINILSCSVMNKIKRVDFIAKCIIDYALNNKDKQVTWTHFGDGEDKNLVVELLNESQLSNLKINITGFVDNFGVRKAMHSKKFHLFLNLSTTEGLPVSLMEAAEAGIPIVATNVGGVGEIVTDADCLVDANSDIKTVGKAMSAAILKHDSLSTDVKSIWFDRFNATSNFKLFWESIFKHSKEATADGR